MKNANAHAPRPRNFRFPAFLVLLLGTAFFCASSQATNYYWDTNGATSGFGSAAGTWGTDAFWSTSNTGVLATSNTTTTSADTVVFGQGANSLTGAATTIGISSNVTVSGINFGAGQTGANAIALGNSTSGTITFAGASAAIQGLGVGPAGTFQTIAAPISSTATSLSIKNGVSLALTNPNNNFGTSSIFVQQGAVLNFVSGALNGTGTITVGGAGNGTLQWATGNTQDITGRTITFSGSGSLFDTNGNNVTLSGAIGSGSSIPFTKLGAGTLTLGGNNTFTGVTTISAGTLSVATIGNGGVAGNLGKATNAATNIVFDGGTLKYTGANATSDRAFTINTGKTATIDTANNISFAGATGNATNGALTKAGTGTLTLTGNSTFTGATTVAAGTLSATGATSLTNSGSISVTGGSIASAKLSVGSAQDFTGKTVNITTANGGAYEKALGAGGAFSTYGTAASSLGGRNTTASFLAGATTSVGTMLTSMSTTSSASNDATRISDVFNVSGMNILSGTMTDTFVLQLNVSGMASSNYLGWNNGGLWTLANAGNTGNNASGAQLGFAGSFATFQTTYGSTLSNYIGAYGVDLSNNNVWAVLNHNSEFAVVPEPSTWALLAFSLTTVMVLRRRRE